MCAQYRRSLYAEYAICVGHQLAGGEPSQLLKKNKLSFYINIKLLNIYMYINANLNMNTHIMIFFLFFLRWMRHSCISVSDLAMFAAECKLT